MIWYEVLALDGLRFELQRRLVGDVDEILDRLIKAGIFSGSDLNYVKISTSPLSPGRVDELLHYLYSVGERKECEHAFSAFCRVLRDYLGLANLAESLEAEAKVCEKTMGPEDATCCELVRAMESLDSRVERKVVEELAKKLECGGASSKGDRENRTVDECAQILKNHLGNLNESLCGMSRDGASCLSYLNTDVRQCFVPLQAISEKEAQRETFQHHRQTRTLAAAKQRQRGSRAASTVKRPSRQHNEDEISPMGREFVLKNAIQLLSSNAEHYTVVNQKSSASLDAASAGSAASSSCVQLKTSCMVIGGAGQGKTTLCQRVVAEVTDAKSGPLAEFNYVFYIPCRYLQRIKSSKCSELLGLHDPAMGLNEVEQTALLNYLQANSKQVLVILDGIDEAGGDGFSDQSAAKLLMQRHGSASFASRLLNATIIAASRPCQAAYDLVKACSSHYRLRGFNSSQLEKFCIQQLGETAGQQCFEELCTRANRPLKEAIRNTPLLCSLLCHQYGFEKVIPSSVTLFYKQFMCSAVSKLEASRGESFGKVQLGCSVLSHLCGGRQFDEGQLVSLETVVHYHLENSISIHPQRAGEGRCDPAAVEVVQALLSLNELCLKELLRNCTTFPSNSLDGRHLLIWQNLGLTQHFEAAPFGGREQLTTLAHLTVQEWCASRALTASDKCIDAIGDCIQDVGVEESRHVFWRFVFGELHPQYLCSALDVVRSVAVDTTTGKLSKKMFLFMMRALLENYLSLQSDVVAADDDHPSQAVYAAAASKLAEEGVDVSRIRLDTNDVMAICNVLELAEHVPLLNVDNCNLSDEHFDRLSTVLDKAVSVDVSGMRLSGFPLESIAAALSDSTQQSHLKTLFLTNAFFMPGKDYESLVRCAQHPSLSTLLVGGHPDVTRALSNDGLRAFADGLMDSSHLNSLFFPACNLLNGCGATFATLLQKVPYLTTLGLWENALSKDDVACTLHALHSHSNIQILNFDNNGLGDDLAPSVIAFLQARRARTSRNESTATSGSLGHRQPLPTCNISLKGNNISTKLLKDIAESGNCGSDIVDISSHWVYGNSVLQRSVQELVEGKGGRHYGMLTDDMMGALGQYLATSTELSIVEVCFCQLTDTGVTTLAMAGMAENRSVKVIDFFGNNIKLPGTVSLLEAAASPLSGIRALSLEKNPVFHDINTSHQEYPRLLQSLSSCKQLHFLSLERTGMSDEVGADIVRCLKHLPHISWLELSHNDIGDDTARALVELSEANCSLRHVCLVQDKITDKGIRYFLQSPAVMAMDRIDLLDNPCSVTLFKAPLLNTESWYNNKELLDYVSD